MTTKSNQQSTNDLLNRIRAQIDLHVQANEVMKKRLKFLFNQLERVNNCWEYRNNSELLAAHLKITSHIYREELDLTGLIDKIGKEVELVEQKNDNLATIQRLEQENSELQNKNDELSKELEKRLN